MDEENEGISELWEYFQESNIRKMLPVFVGK